MFKRLFNRKSRSTKKVTTIWDRGRVIGRIIEGGPTGPTYKKRKRKSSDCCVCESSMPEYIYHRTRVECHKCMEKRLLRYGYQLQDHLKLIHNE